MKKNTSSHLQYHYSEDPNIIEIGVDEVGRGPLFGRVYTSAVILPSNKNANIDTSLDVDLKQEVEFEFDFSKIKDSKKFHSKKKITEVANYIKENAIAWSVAYMDESIVDEVNILQATQMAMHKCINEIIQKNNLPLDSLSTPSQYTFI